MYDVFLLMCFCVHSQSTWHITSCILCKMQSFRADYSRANLRKAFVFLICACTRFHALQEFIS